MTLKVVGVYSSNSARPDMNRINSTAQINNEIYSGKEWQVIKLPDEWKIVNASRLERLTEITKQLLTVPITKPPSDYIILEPGGVVGDRHFSPDHFCKINDIKYLRRRVNQVNIFTKEELDRLNEKFGTKVTGGSVGENILVEGFDINKLSLNTMLKIGDEVVLRVADRRSFCAKFIGAFYRNDYFTKVDFNNFSKKKVGIATQVIQHGIVKVGDTIEILAPIEHIELGSKGPPIKFELYDPNDPTIPPIPDTRQS